MLPTPGIALLTRSLEAHGGMVLSASHNPFEDNGIKIFSSEGAKFPDAWEEEIEDRLAGSDVAPWPTGADIGRLVALRPRRGGLHRARCARPAPRSARADRGARLRARRDLSGGAPRLPRAWARACVVLARRGPTASTSTRRAARCIRRARQARVLRRGRQLGLAFDGDGDRLISVDEAGEIRDGDYALAICGRHLAARGRLKGDTVVTTVMANLGLDEALPRGRHRRR